MEIQFQQSAFDDYQQWAVDDKKIFSKINNLIKEITRTPFKGKQLLLPDELNIVIADFAPYAAAQLFGFMVVHVVVLINYLFLQ